MNTIPVIPGLSMPFFPMRPSHGVSISPINKATVIEQEAKKYFIQPKLNGDRAALLVQSGALHIQNRHGDWYRFGIKNGRQFLHLPDTTLLEGEVFESRFHPFEALVVDGESMLRECPSVRAFEARRLCSLIGVEWLFESPTTGWVLHNFCRSKEWEGVVLKKLGSPYLPLGLATQHSSTWWKRKWA